MSTHKKLLISILLLVIFITIGCYLSGFILIKWLFLKKTPLGLFTYFQYIKVSDLPELVKYTTIIRYSGYLGFGTSFLIWLTITFLLFKTSEQSLHGEARFADASDLTKAKFFKSTDDSIIVGKYNGRLLNYSGQQFAILAAPTRSGKGVGIVIPNLLNYQGSVVVLDIKQENFNLTSGYRQNQLKQEIYLFNPFTEDGRTHRWNPFTYVSSDKHQRVSDLMSIAAMLYPDGDSKDKFWVAQARNAFLAFSLYLFDERIFYKKENKDNIPQNTEPACSLGKLYQLASGDGTELKDFFTRLSQKDFISEACKTAFSGLISQEKETFGSIMGTFKEPLNPWANPIVDKATSGDDFLLTDVRKKKMTIYIGILPNKLAESRIIINLFFSQLINQNTKELPQDNADLKYQCLLLMDEFTSIGKVDIIAHSVSYMAGYNIRLFPIIQSVAQLDAVYGKEFARTIMTNHALQIIYTPREQQDANEYSEMLGYTTIKKHSVSRGRERSVSESDERRALMLPQELKAMPQYEEIIIYEGMPHPAKVSKIRYYEDKIFSSRLLDKVIVKKLKTED